MKGAKFCPQNLSWVLRGKVLLVSAKMGIWSLGLFQTKKVSSLLMVGGKIPHLPGPFFINFPFAPLSLERVEDEKGPFRRVKVLPRFPRQYFLDEEKARFSFSEHEGGKGVKISGWTKGFRCYGPFYANASISLSGNSIFALMEGREDKVQVTGEVSVSEGGSVRFVLGKEIISSLHECKERGFLQEKISPIFLPKPSWSSWLEETDPSLGGEGTVLPTFSILDLSQLEKGGSFSLKATALLRVRSRVVKVGLLFSAREL